MDVHPQPDQAALLQNIANSRKPQRDLRAMEKAELIGRHTYTAANGVAVHIWIREGQFLARGSYEGARFGVTLGASVDAAEAALRQLLVRIEDGSFNRPSETRHLPFQHSRIPKLATRELVNRYVGNIRKLKGAKTARNYLGRLSPMIEFAELPKNARRWPQAQSIDATFALDFRAALQTRIVTPNGNPLAAPKRVSTGQIRNHLTCCGSMLNWAKDPRNGLLPANFLNPFDRQLIGPRMRRDPLAPSTIPMPLRAEMVAAMDAWQLCILALPMVLPCRPEDFSGLLIANVDLPQRELIIGTRLGGDDSTKAGTSFRIPYPVQLDSIMNRLIDGRVDGPLLRRRSIMEGKTAPRYQASTTKEIVVQYDAALMAAGPKIVMATADRKDVFRGVLCKLGGVRKGTFAETFKDVLAEVRPGLNIRFYDIRGSISTEMKNAGVDYMVRRYVTGHVVTRDIMEAYESQDRLHEHMGRYFTVIQPLLTAIIARAAVLGIS